MSYYVTNTESQLNNGKTDIVLFCRDEDRNATRLTVKGYNPYFYAYTSEVDDIRDDLLAEPEVLAIEDGHESIFGDQLSRIEVRTQNTIYTFKDQFSKTFESDVWDTHRLRIDRGIYTGVEPGVEGHSIPIDALEPVDFVGELRVLTFDIEADDRGAFTTDGSKTVLSIVTHDSFTDEYVGFFHGGGRSVGETFPDGKPEGFDRIEIFTDEADMLAGFADYVTEVDCDVFTGWNIIDYDFVQLINRMNRVGVEPSRLSRMDYAGINKRGEPRVKGRIIYDMLEAYKQSQQSKLPSYRLDAIAERELGEQKIDHTGQGIYEMWQDDPAFLMRYNLVDVRLVVAINQAAGIIEFRQALRHQVGVDLTETQANFQFVEMMVRRKLADWKRVAPAKEFRQSDKKFEGAFVFEPFYGVTTNVVGMDLASLYPYTIAMLNASPETRITDADLANGKFPFARAPNGAMFRLDRQGIIPALVEDAIALKSDYKSQQKQFEPGTEEYARLEVRYNVAKTVTNSIYGIVGWLRFFLYDEATAEAVTSMGQEVIKSTQAFLNANEFAEVIYGDTDSNYVRFRESWNKEECLKFAHRMADELNGRVYPALASEWGMADRECLWEIEVESYASVYFQAGTKKRYAMRVTWLKGKDTDETKIAGFQVKRSDTAQLTNDLMKDVLNAILDGADSTIISQLVYDAAGRLSAPETDWAYIGIPQGFSKSWDEYAVETAHVRGTKALNAIAGTNLDESSKPKRVYIRPTHFEETGKIDVLCFEDPADLPERIALDYHEMLEKLITKPLGPILEAVNVDVGAAITGQTQTGLDAFGTGAA